MKNNKNNKNHWLSRQVEKYIGKESLKNELSKLNLQNNNMESTVNSGEKIS